MSTVVTSEAPARVLLLGMMGVGKTTVGHALSTRTGWPYLDNDELVHRATGRTTRTVLDESGEHALRDAESAALTEALRIPPPVIAAVAGGVVENPTDRGRLRDGGYVVWLRARIATLVARVGTGENRPWLSPDPETALRRLYDGRAPHYREVAALVVDVDEQTPGQVAEVICAGLGASVTAPRGR